MLYPPVLFGSKLQAQQEPKRKKAMTIPARFLSRAFMALLYYNRMVYVLYCPLPRNFILRISMISISFCSRLSILIFISSSREQGLTCLPPLRTACFGTCYEIGTHPCCMKRRFIRAVSSAFSWICHFRKPILLFYLYYNVIVTLTACHLFPVGFARFPKPVLAFQT